MQIDALIIGGIVIASIFFYGWLMFLWLPNFIANIIYMPFSKSSDDESVGYEGEIGMGRVVMREVTKGDRRIRKIVVFIVLPIIILVHYLYWDPFYASVEWLFEEVIVPKVGALIAFFSE
jgi:hypothetical protein